MRRRLKTGFTLAELLIALAILGVIATFSIPKVLQAQTESKKNAITKEIIAAISGAYQAYQVENSVTASTTQGDLTPYLNYVSIVTTAVDASCTAPPSSATCSVASILCLKFHNGAVLRVTPNQSFSGTGTSNAYRYHLDADGSFNGERSLNPYLFYNGRITTSEGLGGAVTNSTNTYTPSHTCQPDWFSWD